MERNNPPPKEPVNIILNGGGLGDHIAALPVIKFAAKTADLTVYVPDYLVEFSRKVLKGIRIHSFKEYAKRNKSYHTVETLWKEHTSLRTHLTDYAATMILDKQLDPEEKNYLEFPVDDINLKKFKLPKDYVVLTPGFTSSTRELLPKIVNEISDHIISKNLAVVFLGSEQALDEKEQKYRGNFNNQVDYSKGVNLINKTSINEACAIMGKAKIVVGLDNGLLHLAACTDVPIVGGFTTVEPKYRLPYRLNGLGWNYYVVIPPESLDCRFCQSKWTFVFEHNFTNCYYEDLKCVKQATSKDYIDQLEKIL